LTWNAGSASHLVETLAEQNGLQKFNLQLHRLPEFAYKLCLSGQISFEVDNKEKDFLKAILGAIKPLIEDMRNSPLVAHEKSPLQKQIKEQADEIIRLNEEMAELRIEYNNLLPYWHHFKTEMQLKHGDKWGAALSGPKRPI
jgi:uncharacterized UPF0160 family protein